MGDSYDDAEVAGAVDSTYCQKHKAGKGLWPHECPDCIKASKGKRGCGMKRVFVGGSWDGERLDDEGGRPYVAVTKKQRPVVYDGDISSVVVPMDGREIYRRETIATLGGGRCVFYAESSLSSANAIELLIEGYKANAGGAE